MEMNQSPIVRGFTETGQLGHVVMKHARDAFVDTRAIERQWRALGFSEPPDIARAVEQYDQFLDLIRRSGTTVSFLPRDERTGLDSIYVRDASVISPSGVILAGMGKPLRADEPAAQETALRALALPIAGAIREPGRLEGGDLIWLDPRTVVVGESYRTNREGIRQLRALLGDTIDELLIVPLPHWHGAGEVLHLMSLISPVDQDLAVVYSPLLPVPFRQLLLARGYSLVEVPGDEFDTMGTNVLAVARRRCIMLSGNPQTRTALERAGADVLEYDGSEISVKGAGGPTCLTRPICRND